MVVVMRTGGRGGMKRREVVGVLSWWGGEGCGGRVGVIRVNGMGGWVKEGGVMRRMGKGGVEVGGGDGEGKRWGG